MQLKDSTLFRQQALIGAEWTDAPDAATVAVSDPATGEQVGTVPLMREAGAVAAIEAANAALPAWKARTAKERAALLRRWFDLIIENEDDLAAIMTREQGKPLAEARGEVRYAASFIEWFGEEAKRLYGDVIPSPAADKRLVVVREPIGVCAAFTPWNFPFNQAIRKIVAAIGAGCTLTLKGPEDSPSAVVALAHLFHDAGLPPGVLNIVWGVPSEVSTYLIESPIVRKISFTGSVPVGKQLAALAGAHMKRVTMELGGHSPVLVFDDADIEPAAEMLARFKLRNAGQVCVSPTRFYVQEKAYDKFLARFTEVIGSVKVGNGLDDGTQMGPLAHERRIASMEQFLDDASHRGGKIVAGGSRIGDKGFFFAPTVVTDLPDNAKLMVDEPFGPVAPVTRFKDTEEVLRRANSLPYGLASYVFTNSLKTAHQVSNGLEAGMVNINHFGMALSETPFGGIKDSGIGSEGGQETFDGYLVTKFITQV